MDRPEYFAHKVFGESLFRTLTFSIQPDHDTIKMFILTIDRLH